MNNFFQTVGDILIKPSKDYNLKRENANIDGDASMGQMLRVGSETTKEFYLSRVIPPKYSELHRNGDVHIHDLDFYSLTTTCCQIDIAKLLADGFDTGHGRIREPNSIGTAAALTCIAIQSNQNDQHGGQSVPNFDYGLAPYVDKTFRKNYFDALVKMLAGAVSEERTFNDVADSVERVWSILRDEEKRTLTLDQDASAYWYGAELKYLGGFFEREFPDKTALQKLRAKAIRVATEQTERDTFQAMEALVHNLNTMHSRAGAQVPFSSINYGTDTSAAGRIVIKSILNALDAGLGNGETPIFPIHIFRVKKGVNAEEGSPNYDLFKLACKVSAKRMFPNFSFQDAPYNLRYYEAGRPETEIAYMGCRTRVIGNVYDPENEISFSRGNLSFTSINLPRVGLELRNDPLFKDKNAGVVAKEQLDKVWERVEPLVDACAEQLYHRFELQCARNKKNYPFMMGQNCWLDAETLDNEESLRPILSHGTLSVGFIGLAEMLYALFGGHHGEYETLNTFGLKLIGLMRAKLDKLAQEKKLNYTLLATPAEGLSGRFLRIDRERYGIVPGVTDKEFYTNSFHVPVEFPIFVGDKIRKEAPYHELTNAGHITYVELNGDPRINLSAFEKIVVTMMENGIGYGAINHPIDRDPDCGYEGFIDGRVCPKCGRKETKARPFERIRRITGYLVGGLERFNDAKRAEESMRVKHG